MSNQLKESLSMLLEVNGVLAVVLSSRDGMVIEHISNGILTDSNVTGAMSAGIFGMIKKSIERISEGDNILNGDLNQVLIELTNAKIMSVDVSDGILSVISNVNINLGLLRLYMKKTSEKISEVMKEISKGNHFQPKF